MIVTATAGERVVVELLLSHRENISFARSTRMSPDSSSVRRILSSSRISVRVFSENAQKPLGRDAEKSGENDNGVFSVEGVASRTFRSPRVRYDRRDDAFVLSVDTRLSRRNMVVLAQRCVVDARVSISLAAKSCAASAASSSSRLQRFLGAARAGLQKRLSTTETVELQARRSVRIDSGPIVSSITYTNVENVAYASVKIRNGDDAEPFVLTNFSVRDDNQDETIRDFTVSFLGSKPTCVVLRPFEEYVLTVCRKGYCEKSAQRQSHLTDAVGYSYDWAPADFPPHRAISSGGALRLPLCSPPPPPGDDTTRTGTAVVVGAGHGVAGFGWGEAGAL